MATPDADSVRDGGGVMRLRSEERYKMLWNTRAKWQVKRRDGHIRKKRGVAVTARYARGMKSGRLSENNKDDRRLAENGGSSR